MKVHPLLSIFPSVVEGIAAYSIRAGIRLALAGQVEWGDEGFQLEQIGGVFLCFL